MKSLIAIAGLFLAITAMCQDLSPVFNLSPCPVSVLSACSVGFSPLLTLRPPFLTLLTTLQRSCAMETSGRAKEFGCSSGDIACLCKNKEYQRALMECAKKCKPEEIEALAKAGREVCDSAGACQSEITALFLSLLLLNVHGQFDFWHSRCLYSSRDWRRYYHPRSHGAIAICSCP